MGIRRRARECALQLLYQFDMTHDDPSDVLGSFWEMQEEQPVEITEMAERLYRCALDFRKEIDALIRQHSHHWRLQRMSSVDRNILRLAVGEMLVPKDMPAPIVINEAVELAKKYGGEESSRFINGVLDSICTGLNSADGETHPVSTS